jgi:hypothetical protein
MKALLVLIALVLPALGHAASPEENYVAARNAHIKALAAAGQRGAPDKEREAQQNRALADLEKQIRRLVGRTGLKDIKGDGRINLEGLIEGDMEFGMLDGLVYEAKDGKTRIVVTTQNLLKNWLAEHRAMRDRDVPIPQGMAPALRWRRSTPARWAAARRSAALPKSRSAASTAASRPRCWWRARRTSGRAVRANWWCR